jgi:hypothetical protein
MVKASQTEHYAMKAYGGVDVWIHGYFTSVLVGGEWSAARSGHFTAASHWREAGVGPRGGLDDMEKWEFLPLPGLELLSLHRPACATASVRAMQWSSREFPYGK